MPHAVVIAAAHFIILYVKYEKENYVFCHRVIGIHWANLLFTFTFSALFQKPFKICYCADEWRRLRWTQDPKSTRRPGQVRPQGTITKAGSGSSYKRFHLCHKCVAIIHTLSEHMNDTYSLIPARSLTGVTIVSYDWIVKTTYSCTYGKSIKTLRGLYSKQQQ